MSFCTQKGKIIKLGEGTEGVVNAVLHKQTGTLRAVKWCKRATEAEVHILGRLARTRGLGRLIGCMFRRTVVKHGALRGSWRPQSTRQEGRGYFFCFGGGEHPEIIWTFAFCLQPVRGLAAREASADNGPLVRPGNCPPTPRKLSFKRI